MFPHLGYYNVYYNQHGGADISEMEILFPLALSSEVGLLGHTAVLFLNFEVPPHCFHSGCTSGHSHPPCTRVDLSDVSSSEKLESGDVTWVWMCPLLPLVPRGHERQASLENLSSPDFWSVWRFDWPCGGFACSAPPGAFSVDSIGSPVSLKSGCQLT